MFEQQYIQDRLLDTEYILTQNSLNTPKREETHGNRISPSQIENLSYLYDQYLKSPNEKDFFHNVLLEKPLEREKELLSAKWSIYGTQFHQLQYFTQLFERVKYLNRYPSYNDFMYTFPYRESDYYDGLLKLLDFTDLKNSEDVSQAYWNEWRMNGQDFTPKRRSRYMITPSTIRLMWENGVIPLSDLTQFNINKKNIDREKLNPEQTVLINEVFTITNIFFNDLNLQVGSYIDEICIPKEFPNKPIHIIDYKTGKQFKQPEYKERVQIFLMMTGVLANILDRVKTVKFNYSDWDIVHNTIDLPFFSKRELLNPLRSSIYFDDIIQSSDIYNNCFKFSYIDPLTQRCIDIDTKDIGLGTPEDIHDMLMYLDRINNFYSKYKSILRPKISGKLSSYSLPVFPIKNFDRDNGFSRHIQLGLI